MIASAPRLAQTGVLTIMKDTVCDRLERRPRRQSHAARPSVLNDNARSVQTHAKGLTLRGGELPRKKLRVRLAALAAGTAFGRSNATGSKRHPTRRRIFETLESRLVLDSTLVFNGIPVPPASWPRTGPLAIYSAARPERSTSPALCLKTWCWSSIQMTGALYFSTSRPQTWI